MERNSTFCGGEPSWANACVGDNGQPDYFDYAKGYSSAANLLIKTVLDGRGLKHSVDQFVYPICFNMRHSVELRLKGAFSTLEKLSKYRGKLEDFDLRGSHDIGLIWAYIKRVSEKIDERFGFFVGFLDQRILDIAKIDSTGQTFRYPDDGDKVKHLVEVSLINIKNLSKRFSELEYILDCFEYFCDDIVIEYKFGTHTTKLSRSQLLAIGRILPARETWGDDAFKKLVAGIKNKYGLSNNDFSRAICKLKGHYGAVPAIEPPPLVHIDEQGIFAFFETWIELNSLDELRNRKKIQELDFSDIQSVEAVFDKIKERERKEAEIWPRIEGVFSLEWLADLKALYELHGSQYSEKYVGLVALSHRSLLSDCEDNPSRFRYLLFKLLERPSAIDYITKSLFLVGYGKFAELLIAKYSLEGCFQWLERARAGELFYEPFRATLVKCAKVFTIDFESDDE